MKIDKGSIGFRLLVPIFAIVAIITVSLLILVQRISDHIQEDYHRFTAAASAHQITTILETAASELITAQLTGNPVVVEAKKSSVGDAVRLSWSRNDQAGIISSADGATVLSTLNPEVTHAILARRSRGYFTLADKAGRFHCYMDSFAPWGWTVITVARETSSYFTRRAVALLVPLITLGSLLMASGLLFILRRNLQQPVTAMVSDVSQGRHVAGTGMTELDRIGTAINDAFDRVRERTDELESEVRERKKAESAVRAKEEHIRLLLHSTAEGIYGVDQNGRCSFCNPSALRILGYGGEEDLLGRNIHQLIHHTRTDGTAYPDDECSIYRAYREGVRVHVEDEVFWKRDGSSVPIEYWSYPVLEHGVVKGAVVTFIDLSERRRSQEFIRDILETVDEGFLVVARDYTILSANGALSRMVGAPLDAIVGRKCHEVLHGMPDPCSDDPVDCSVRRVFETGAPCMLVHTHRRPGLQDIQVEIKCYPARDAAGRVATVIMTIVDITDKRKLEDQLQQAQKMEAIGQLAGGIAHDFNNILSAIVGYASLLKMRTDEGSTLRSYSEQVLLASERAASLTRQILAFGRKQIITLQPVRVNDSIKALETLLRRILGEDIEIVTALTDREAIVQADAGQIEQVMMNLATNARDAMPSGGKLIITTEINEFDEASAYQLGLERAGAYALIAVSDTGVGMDERTRQRIFEPFFTTKELGKGTGLGLSIVYGIIKQHNGQIIAYSEAGKGTTFRIYLPLTKDAVRETKGIVRATIRGGTETLLLAEDSDELRVFTQHVLEEFGYRVIVAKDGEEAVARFREHQDAVRLCLFDVIMPKKNGKEALKEIRAARTGMKALFMSGYAADVLRERDGIAEDVLLLSKPIVPDNLLRKVREVLDA
jgi:PAS domain S-box-containing protein